MWQHCTKCRRNEICTCPEMYPGASQGFLQELAALKTLKKKEDFVESIIPKPDIAPRLDKLEKKVEELIDRVRTMGGKLNQFANVNHVHDDSPYKPPYVLELEKKTEELNKNIIKINDELAIIGNNNCFREELGSRLRQFREFEKQKETSTSNHCAHIYCTKCKRLLKGSKALALLAFCDECIKP